MKYLKTALIFLLTLILSYLIVTLLITSFSLYSSVSNSVTPITKYVDKHELQLKEKVFGEIFQEASKCLTIQTRKDAENCQNSIGKKIADNLEDDELAPGYMKKYGPVELFFVKEKEGKFESLGWDGKLITGTLLPLQKILLNNNFVLVKSFTDQCNYFSKSANYLICEVFSPIQLDNQTNGYLGWKMGFRDGGDFRNLPIILYYLIFALPILFYSGPSISNPLNYITIIFISLSPFLLAFFLTYLYLKSKKRKTGKHK